jgi:hypothetical protein
LDIIYSVKLGDTLYKLAQQYKTTVDAIVKSNPGINFRNIPIGKKIIIPQSDMPMESAPSFSPSELRDTLRTLWEQHVAWTRMTIISAASGNPDLNATITRLLRNPTDMANALKPFYGEANAAKFEQLIRDHLVIANQLVAAAKAGNTVLADSLEKQWYANSDEIAKFLHSINPYIPEDSFRNMLHEHLAMTKAEAVARLNNDYMKDIALYDNIEKQALMMADAISGGIIKQFAH